MSPVLAKGTKIKVGDAASPEVFTTITGVMEVNVPNPTVDSKETTDHDSTARSRTYEAGLIEPGDLSFLYKYDKDNTQHTALETDRDAGTAKNYQTELQTSPVEVNIFSAFVTSVEPETEIDGFIMKRANLKLSGAIT